MALKISIRRFIQAVFFFIQNPHLKNFFIGRIYQGSLKKICTPGLNCYSCPAAVTSCPIGAIQLFIAGSGRSISMFITGFLVISGTILGRFICGYICPFGLIQDLLYKIKSPKIKTALRYLKYVKYFILAVFVIALPFFIRHELSGLGDPWFCKYICPSGMIFGAVPLLAADQLLHNLLGMQFVIKAAISFGIIVLSVLIFRFFCRVLCPLGAFYSFFNPIAFLGINCDKEKCTNCTSCAQACNIRINPSVKPNSPECIRCGDCVNACKTQALRKGKRQPQKQPAKASS